LSQLEAGHSHQGSASPKGSKVAAGHLVASEGETDGRGSSTQRSQREILAEAGLPVVPSVSLGVSDIAQLKAKLVEAGFVKRGKKNKLKLHRPVWIRGPRLFSAVLNSLDDVERLFKKLKEDGRANESVLESYIPNAVVVGVQSYEEVFEKTKNPRSLWFNLEKRSYGTTTHTAEDFRISPGLKVRLAEAAYRAAEATGDKGPGLVKFLVNVGDGSFYVMKRKPGIHLKGASAKTLDYLERLLHPAADFRSLLKEILGMEEAERENFEEHLVQADQGIDEPLFEISRQLRKRIEPGDQEILDYLVKRIIIPRLDSRMDQNLHSIEQNRGRRAQEANMAEAKEEK
jgi:hypothetical protein